MLNWIRVLGQRIHGLVSRRRLDEEFQQELDSHLEMLTEENLRRGMPPEEARRAAQVRLGGLTQLRETNREMWGLPWLETLFQDCRYGLRQLRRNPGFTIVAVLTLALGIGANATIFSVLYRDLLRPLPYPHGSRLVMFGMVVPAVDSRPFLFGSTYLELRHAQTPFESMTSWRPGVRGCNLAGKPPVRMACAQVGSHFLPTFEVSPVLGRNFTPEENRPGAPGVCLISYGLWQSRFGGSRGVIGRLLSIDGKHSTIIGVLPRAFEWPTLAHVDIVLPEKLPASEASANPGAVLRAYARLKPGVSVAQARAQIHPFVEQFIHSAPPMFRKEIRLGIISVREDQVGSIRQALWVLFGAALALLLLASANVTNLMLAHGEAHQREMAVRAALGASRWRLTRLQLVESMLLGLGGGLMGAGLTILLLHLCVVLAPAGIPRIGQAHLGTPAALLVAGTSLLAGILCGFGSSVAVRPSSLFLAGRSTGPARRKLGSALIVLQVAVSLLLLAGAGLLLGTLRNIENIPLGMDTSHIVTAEVTLGNQSSARAGEAAEFFERLQARLRSLPGVTGVAVSDSLPPAGAEHSRPFFVLHAEGHAPLEKGTGGLVGWRAVSPGYFRVLDIPIVEGRGFVASDSDPHVNAIILNKTLAKRLFPDEDPVGRRVQFTHPPSPWYDVVGITANVKNAGLLRKADPEYYLVRKNEPNLGLAGFPDLLRHAFFVVRSPLAGRGVGSMVRETIASLDPSLIPTILTLGARVERLRVRSRFDAALISLFAALGLLLAAIGLYGLVSYSAVRRTHEIGIRMALGAEKRDVLEMVMRQGLKLVLIGVVIGIGGALALARFLSSLLYGVKPTDPLTFIVVSLVLIAVALAACYIPARRAAKVDPIVALRYE